MSCTEKELEYAKKYRESHPEAVKASTKKWRDNNRKRYLDAQLEWRSKDENKAKRRVNIERFHKNNPEYKNQYQRKWWKTLKARYLNLKITARAKNRELTVTFEQWQELLKQSCYYCGSAKKADYGYNLDRIDSDVGYTPDNVVPCCQICNAMKSNMSLNDFTAQVKRIAETLKI